ncbi:NADH-quinone oxidoreductase subunit NuoG [Aromatoleum bremense]|uniref:NADH-quinone oxidoreductase n=1 Tax=Aromatoleum bremense TaxID=76115 RepID=A0ABX1NUI7_9RHOO|nr:NADH-quinone oxidoreductase subunit NuoG [Aromatoleum bremense]NMG15679.1 NADH-quinone oxidoreductase subunit G [Aromatoleum bremense]QTQ30661.1 NADH-quinone oxidoreductase, G subunit [Aromatoleum bremense]
MLEIEIDGKQVSVEDGSTVMDAATKIGAYIPHFCYHKKLSIAASCRMCLVQVEKAPKPLPACATPVTNGMKVWTRSDQAIKAQKGVMEFLLINHPLDCPICDQGGECQLQDLAVGYGGSQSRYEEEKRVVFNKNLGPLVATDMTRCINCTRCVRFTTEIAGMMELGQAFRGEHAEIMPFIEKTLESELSGNIIDLCPVGALTSKPFRFAARTWELSRRKSISSHDSLGSNLVVQVKHDIVKRVLPLENEGINECWLSDKDRFSYEGLNSEDRLTVPMIKQDGEWKEVDWQAALEFVANGLLATAKENGPATIGALASPHSTLEELHLLQKLARTLGTDNIDFRLRQWDFRADGHRTGAPWLGMPIADVAGLNRLLIIGSFLRKDAPLLAQRVRQAAKRGLQVSAIHAAGDNWLLPVKNEALVAPSGMVGMLLQVAAALAAEKGMPVVDELATRVPAEISDEARTIAQNLATGARVAVWLGNFAEQSEFAAELHVVAQEIARLSGGSLGFIGEAANSVGGYLAKAAPIVGGFNARQMVEQPLKSYLLLNAEPDLDFANPVATMAALRGARLVVALSAFTSPALRSCANVLLPITPFTETSGTFVNCEGRVQSFNAVARARGEARPGWKVLRVLGNLLELEGFDQNDSEAVAAEVLSTDVAERLGNGVSDVELSTRPAAAGGLERVSDVPIYFADPLVRRAPSLQKTRDGAVPSLRASAATLARLGFEAGARARVKQGGAVAELGVVVDEKVADNCVRIAAAHPATAALGAMCGEISLERV